MNIQELARVPWADTTKRSAGAKPIGPVPGLVTLDSDWEIHASRFAKALVRLAAQELYSCFGPEWTGDLSEYHSLTGGITAVGVTFYTVDRLEQYYNHIPEARNNPDFQELLQQHTPGISELICAVWPSAFVLHHSEGELMQCEYWVSASHPESNQTFSICPAWPPRRLHG